MKKRNLAVVLASVMLLGTGVIAFANNVEARGISCPECGVCDSFSPVEKLHYACNHG